MFKIKTALFSIFLVFATFISSRAQNVPEVTNPGYDFNNGWEFIKDADTSITPILFKPSGNNWSKVSLPHTANIEPVNKTAQQWQGICLYRKFFTIPSVNKGKYIAMQIDAAMSDADVYLNGKHIDKHLGGYLPFQVNITADALYGKANCLLIRLNNRDNAEIPPGKPIKDLDFNYYSGIYRNAWLIVKNKTHISNAVEADHVNGGGVLVNYTDISTVSAQLHVKCEVINDNTKNRNICIKTVLSDVNGKFIAQNITADSAINALSVKSFKQDIRVNAPKLWSPDSPVLYHLSVYVLKGKQVLDSIIFRTGIRDISFKASGFYLNGAKCLISGTNRHQEYPFIGNALSDNAQYRDAYKIKQAGFNFVRCSHYPPSPAFLDACDELGLLVMDSTPGWQYFGDETFQRNSLKNIRDMIHRDRNHACIVVWEASLNETRMKHDYMEKATREVHDELPFNTTFTCGWIDTIYDVFIPARQHAQAPDYWKKYKKDKPLLIAEYGDWEYYEDNAGFNQTEYKNLKKDEKSSRQVRGYGEERLLQQALNFQEGHNDNLNGNIVGDLIWLMFDYKRGYAKDLEMSGIMDIYRVPKFSYYFFQSQKNAAISKPMLFIANYWNDPADKTVKIYSNCDEVELKLNGNIIARQKPDTDRNTNNLSHPPFTFHVANYEAGTLQATGYIDHKNSITSTSVTPSKPYKIILKADYSNRPLKAGCKDAIFVYAYVTDKYGTTIPDATNLIKFSIDGPARMVGRATSVSEAGIAPILIMGANKPGPVKIKASSGSLVTGKLILVNK